VANLRDIRRRIRSVQKTQQITSAMRMVSAAKLRRAQDAIIAARPYSNGLFRLIGEIARRQPETADHPLLERRAAHRTVELAVFTSDRGLCGAFNAGAIRHTEAVLEREAQHFDSVVLSVVGRKGAEYFQRRRGGQIVRAWTGLGGVDYARAAEIAGHLSERFLSGAVDRVILVGNEFVSALSQPPRDVPLLPFSLSGAEAEGGKSLDPFDVEPDPATIFFSLLPRALEFSIYRVLLESQAGEHAARMAAMEAATRNTDELIRSLTLQFNRVRQAAITKELVEIVSGAEAL
jgi:F-type H+-transporting ATPase subunit gamma